MKKSIAALGVVLCLAGWAIVQQLVSAYSTALPTEEAPEIGYLAPSFELETLDGGTAGIARSDEPGKPAIVNFWASWCDPCRLEAPFLSDLHAKYKDQVEFLGVNVTKYDRLSEAEAFVQQYQIRFPTLLDKEGIVFAQYSVPGYPTSFFIDRHGVIRDIVIGLPGHEEFESKLAKLID